MANGSAKSARNYVLGLALPEFSPSFDVGAEIEFSGGREALAVGAQLAEFSDAVPTSLRGPITDCILLAQLAANKAAGDAEDVFRWYDKYLEVLQNIGWTTRNLEFQTQQVSAEHGDVHKEIIPVIAMMLGPQVAAVSIVVGVLNGLQNMDKSTPWITLFDRASQHAHGAKFQVSFVDADADGQPEISLLCFGIQADRSITQVLFFKFSAQSAEVKTATGKLGVSMERLTGARDAIAARVKPFIEDYVTNLEL
jgi:hypothetical protein